MSETPKQKAAKKSVDQQLEDKIVISPVNNCHVWIGARSGKDKYPILASQADGQKPVYVHRLLWERKHGSIPQGPCEDGSHRMEIHHACPSGNQCVNSEHHVLLTSRQHVAIHRAMRACQVKPKKTKQADKQAKKPTASVRVDAVAVQEKAS